MNYKFSNRLPIKRSAVKPKNDYHDYRDQLKEDFHKRCAYCDTCDDIMLIPFEIDHFIPRHTFNGVKDYLDTDYNNLVYSCKKCNISKGSQFSGDIHSADPTNELFYDPVKIDYNEVFYRNEYGIIVSDDDKGKAMIAAMRLYRPIYALTWIYDQTRSTIKKLEKRIEITDDGPQKTSLKEALEKLHKYFFDITMTLSANYNSKIDNITFGQEGIDD